jgi:hypothetical protein
MDDRFARTTAFGSDDRFARTMEETAKQIQTPLPKTRGKMKRPRDDGTTAFGSDDGRLNGQMEDRAVALGSPSLWDYEMEKTAKQIQTSTRYRGWTTLHY